MKKMAKFGMGPMSTETIEAVFQFSQQHRSPIMLIASKNQIDHSGGYVNGWNTEEYGRHIVKMKLKYPFSDVLICRDHCGPGFNGCYDLEDTYQTIETDIRAGFDLIHIDFCHFRGSKKEQFEASRKAIEFCLKLNSNIKLEIGTDENEGEQFTFNMLQGLEEEIEFFQEVCQPEFFVVQTGSLVKEIQQAGHFNREFTKEIFGLLQRKGLKLKEHNADYLSQTEIANRKGVVSAMNIAPQFGVVQTSLVFQKCLQYGIDYSDFESEVMDKRRWEKWLIHPENADRLKCLLIAGHYHFNSVHYRKIEEKISNEEDLSESIVSALMGVIEHYENSF